MKHEICVADMSPVRELPGMEDHQDTWQVQCSCGWRNFALMPEAAADEVAAMHRNSYTRAEVLAFGGRVREACAFAVGDGRDERETRRMERDVRAVDVARLLDSEVDPEAAWTKGNIP